MQRDEDERRYRGAREYDLGEDGPYVYHGRRGGQAEYGSYGGGEESCGGERSRSRAKGVLRSNPMLLLVIVDILLILLVAGILYPFLSDNQNTQEIAGYSFSIQAYRQGDWAHVNVLVEWSETDGSSEGERVPEEEKIDIRFAPSEGNVRARHLIVPPGKNNPQIVRTRFKADEATQVRAIVRFAGRRLDLETELSERE